LADPQTGLLESIPVSFGSPIQSFM